MVLDVYIPNDKRLMGKYHLKICINVSCMLRGGDVLFDNVCAMYGIGNNETSKDGLISVQEIPCMGVCAKAPVIAVNDDVYEDVSWEDLEGLLVELR